MNMHFVISIFSLRSIPFLSSVKENRAPRASTQLAPAKSIPVTLPPRRQGRDNTAY